MANEDYILDVGLIRISVADTQKYDRKRRIRKSSKTSEYIVGQLSHNQKRGPRYRVTKEQKKRLQDDGDRSG